jgi:DNA-binding IscR family transcriptional regulator
VECATDPGYCERCGVCVTVELWQEIHKAVTQVVDGTTLADLVAKAREKQEN